MAKLPWYLKLVKAESTFDRKTNMWNTSMTIRINNFWKYFQFFKNRKYGNTSNS